MESTWVLVADRGRARLFALEQTGKVLRELRDFLNPEGRAHGRDLEQDRPPRTQSSHSSARATIEPHTSLEEKTAQRFAHTLAAALAHGRGQGQYRQLILVAPPRFVGALHHALDAAVRACVISEVHKDLTTATATDILAHLTAPRAG